ncbi:MAG: Flp pilus assembly protein CpaB [Pirellulales bacterium]|nr:Flp pilus assembly protein CpaB [Pirellulales bacterium]
MALALGCGLVASIGISQVLDGNNKPAAVETSPIYVALQNVNVGDPLTDKMVSLEEWPKDKVPVGAITKWEDLEDRRPRSNIYQGEPILDNKLLAKGQTNDPIQGVPTGMRLKTVSVDARKSAAGLLSPGDRVDLQIFVKPNQSQGISHAFTKIFLQNIRVFAIDQTIDKAADGEESRSVAKTVSLIVTPSQASRITLAENMGEISLIPRNPDDDKVVDDSEQGTDELFGRSTANNRKIEQESDESQGPLAGFKAMMAEAMAGVATQAAAPPAPSFEMTILFPGDTSTVQFSANGNPIDAKTTGGPAPMTPPAEFVAPPSAPSSEPGPSDAATPADAAIPADFPIDLRLN